MAQYHVVKDGERWEVKVRGRTVKSGNTKASAVKKAKKLARKKNGVVVIHRANNLIQKRVSYE